MHYRRLGRTNLNVSVVGIGTTQLRRVPEKEAIATLKRAFELGINLVNTGPDYEGADELIRLALQEIDVKRPIHLSVQCGGGPTEVERVFEQTCEKFDTPCIDLFGVAAIAEQEAFGHNIWGTGGVVEFLQAKQEEGRIRGLFASDHGSPEHMKELLERDVFDALMLAYNPLGFHLITFRPETVWQLETPPLPLVKAYEWETIPRTGREILPLAKQKDVGVMLMKPLAGGLLCAGKTFPPHPWREDLPQPLEARDVLRYLLMDEAVSCVVPGMASVAEVEENTAAGTGVIELTPEQRSDVEAGAARLTKVLCSRCGECDDLCSKDLPISFLFRAAYHALYPSAPFELSSNLNYFHLHPWEESACESCANPTCRCPVGIDIPGELKAIHRKMVELRDRGLVPTGDTEPESWTTGQSYSFKVLSQELPALMAIGQTPTVRLHLRNTGTQTWYQQSENGHGAVALAIDVDHQRIQTLRLRQDVCPKESCHFALTLAPFQQTGPHSLMLKLVDPAGAALPEEDHTTIRATIWATNAAQPLPVAPDRIPSSVQLDRFERERLIETLLKENAELKYQHQKVVQQKQASDDSIQHFEQELAYLSTGKAAIRQILKKTLHKLGLFDWFYRNYERVVPIYNFVMRDRWTPATIQAATVPLTEASHAEPEAPPADAVKVEVNGSRVRQPPLSRRTSGAKVSAQTTIVDVQERSPTAAVTLIDHTIASEGLTGVWSVWRIVLENSGTVAWHAASAGLGVFLDNRLVTIARFTEPVIKSGARTTLTLPIQLPETAGAHQVKLDVTLDGQTWLSQTGAPALELALYLTERQGNQTERLMAIAQKHDNWFYSPGQGIHRSQGKPTFPLFAESGQGAILTDVEGRSFVDLHMGWGCSLLGYANERIQGAIAAALNSPPLPSLTHRLEIEVAEALCRYFPWGDEVLFGKNGSDVTTWAVRTARIATGRRMILYVGYHGWQDWNAAVRGFAATGIPADRQYAIPLPYLDLQALEAAVATHANDLAAILVEPAATAVHLDDPHHTQDGIYLKRAEELARRHNALFILDEIMTGFRFRGGSAQQDYGLTPDLTCLGKALANGMPLSALVGRRDVLRQHIGRIFYAPTNKGEVYSYAAALAALQVYQGEAVPEIIWGTGDRLRQSIHQLCRDLDLDAGLVGPPYRMYFGFFGELEQQDTYCRTLLQQELARHGVISHKGYVLPSIAHDEGAIEVCVSAFRAALTAIREAIAANGSVHSLEIPDVIGEKRMASDKTAQNSTSAGKRQSQEKHFPQTEGVVCNAGQTDARAKLRQEILEGHTVMESPPATINIELTGRCNVKPACTFCVGKNLTDYEEPGHLKNDLLEHYWQYLDQSQRVNDCSYGEPLLFPRFQEVVERLSEQGVRFGFTTNGLLLTPERAQFLIGHADALEFVVSLNAATAETYYKLHGQDFEQVLSNLQFFMDHFRAQQGGRRSPVILSFIAMRTNYQEAIDFLRLTQRLGVERVLLRHLFDIRAGDYQVNNFDHKFVYEDERLLFTDYKALEEQIRASAEFDSLEIHYQWNAETSFIAEQAEPDIDIPCLFPWKFLCIRPLHNMYTPCVFLKKSIASPSNTNLEEVWNGETMVEMRSALAKGEIPGFCKAYGDCCPIVLEQTRQR